MELGIPGGNERGSGKVSGKGVQKILAVLHRGGDVCADPGEPPDTILGTDDPEIFCFILIMRRSRSSRLSVNGTDRSTIKARTLSLWVSRRGKKVLVLGLFGMSLRFGISGERGGSTCRRSVRHSDAQDGVLKVRIERHPGTPSKTIPIGSESEKGGRGYFHHFFRIPFPRRNINAPKKNVLSSTDNLDLKGKGNAPKILKTLQEKPEHETGTSKNTPCRNGPRPQKDSGDPQEEIPRSSSGKTPSNDSRSGVFHCGTTRIFRRATRERLVRGRKDNNAVPD